MIHVAALLAVASLGLVRAPYVGVACRAPSSTVCGRIGIAIWLRHPARSATAELAGARVRLHAGGLGGRGPTYWEGYAHPQGLKLPRRWHGNPPRFLTLQLTLRYPQRTARGSVRILLRPGWG